MARLRRSNVSLGLMLESTSSRLREKGAAHWRAPDKAPALRLRVIEEAGRQKIRVHHRNTDRDRRNAGGAD